MNHLKTFCCMFLATSTILCQVLLAQEKNKTVIGVNSDKDFQKFIERVDPISNSLKNSNEVVERRGETVENLMGVTNIKAVVNNTDRAIFMFKRDVALYKNDSWERTTEIPANGGVWSGDMWIPWATNSDEFVAHHLAIGVKTWGGTDNQISWLIWQQGDFVRSLDIHNKIFRVALDAKALWIDNAPPIKGDSRVNGDRKMIVSIENNKMVVKLENY